MTTTQFTALDKLNPTINLNEAYDKQLKAINESLEGFNYIFVCGVNGVSEVPTLTNLCIVINENLSSTEFASAICFDFSGVNLIVSSVSVILKILTDTFITLVSEKVKSCIAVSEIIRHISVCERK